MALHQGLMFLTEHSSILFSFSAASLRRNLATSRNLRAEIDGMDVTMIMKLPGHNDIKTTMRYLHVANRDMLQIISPLDDLQLT